MLTPTIVHFVAALLLSALMHIPWQTTGIFAGLLFIIGFIGAIYVGIVAFRIRRQRVYLPNLEDWVFHVVLPLFAYAVIALSSFMLLSHLHEALYGVGAAALLLLFIGVHNAWDNIAYFVFVHNTEKE